MESFRLRRRRLEEMPGMKYSGDLQYLTTGCVKLIFVLVGLIFLAMWIWP